MTSRNLSMGRRGIIAPTDPTPPPKRPGGAGKLPVPPLSPPAEAVAAEGDARHPLARRPQVLPLWLTGVVSETLVQRIIVLNRRAARGEAVVAETLAIVLVHLSSDQLKMIRARVRRLDPVEARRLLGRLGFVASSLQRQDEIATGVNRLGLILRRVPGLTDTMVALADRTGQPPRDSAWTVWLDEPGFGWINDELEHLYGEMVRSLNAEFERLGSALAQMLRCGPGAGSFGDVTGAAAAVNGLSLRRRVLANRPGAQQFRSFIVPMEINGEIYEGPDPTDTAAGDLVRQSLQQYAERFEAENSPWRIFLPSLFKPAADARIVIDLREARRREASDELAFQTVGCLALALATFRETPPAAGSRGPLFLFDTGPHDGQGDMP